MLKFLGFDFLMRLKIACDTSKLDKMRKDSKLLCFLFSLTIFFFIFGDEGYSFKCQQKHPRSNLPDIAIYREGSVGEFWRSSRRKSVSNDGVDKACAEFKFNDFLKNFYQSHRDDYDFIVLFVSHEYIFCRSAHSIAMNRHIKGIGQGNASSSCAKRLKNLVVYPYTLAEWKPYKGRFSLASKSVLITLAHELGHHWLVGIKSIRQPIATSERHWAAQIDLFSGDPAYCDPMGGNGQWIIKGDKFVVDVDNLKYKFSDISLYLMGFVPSWRVAPIYTREFNKKKRKYDPVKKITIDEIIRANGERIPFFEASQKNFRVVFVVLAGRDEQLDPGYLEDIKNLQRSFAEFWCEATSGLSHIFFSS